MRLLFGTILVLALVAIGTYLLGYWSLDQVTVNSWRVATTPAAGPVSTSTTRDRMWATRRAGWEGREQGGRFSVGCRAHYQIRSKMALDDSGRARAIDVSTTDGVVTLAGTVGSGAEHAQAVRLARDTKGIKQVVDHLKVVVP